MNVVPTVAPRARVVVAALWAAAAAIAVAGAGGWALIEVGFLWLSIAMLIVLAARGSTIAAYLLLPYLLWVAFAAALNLAVVRLNAPF